MIPFTKMQGLGNDYVYLDCTKTRPDDLPALAVRVSNRHFGVGSDGLICVFPSDCADFRMRMFNADGSEGEMCGNGIRCVGKFVFDKGLTEKHVLTVETLAGIKTLTLSVEDGKVTAVTVDMGEPKRSDPIEISVKGKTYTGIPVSMGNPHLVIFLDEIDDLNLEDIGPHFETCSYFPNRVNTEFVQVINSDTVRMRVWERGSGETMACGTGACAVAVAAQAAGHTGEDVTVKLLGGDLKIRLDGKDGRVYMTGPAVTVFDGVLL